MAPIPVTATSAVFADYIDAARTNLANLVRLAHGLRDSEFEREAQFMLDSFDSAATGARELIEVAGQHERAAA